MEKMVGLVPMFRCKRCGVLYNPHRFGILMVEEENLSDQGIVKAVMNVSEIHGCDIDKMGIAVCVGFERANL